MSILLDALKKRAQQDASRFHLSDEIEPSSDSDASDIQALADTLKEEDIKAAYSYFSETSPQLSDSDDVIEDVYFSEESEAFEQVISDQELQDQADSLSMLEEAQNDLELILRMSTASITQGVDESVISIEMEESEESIDVYVGVVPTLESGEVHDVIPDNQEPDIIEHTIYEEGTYVEAESNDHPSESMEEFIEELQPVVEMQSSSDIHAHTIDAHTIDAEKNTVSTFDQLRLFRISIGMLCVLLLFMFIWLMDDVSDEPITQRAISMTHPNTEFGQIKKLEHTKDLDALLQKMKSSILSDEQKTMPPSSAIIDTHVMVDSEKSIESTQVTGEQSPQVQLADNAQQTMVTEAVMPVVEPPQATSEVVEAVTKTIATPTPMATTATEKTATLETAKPIPNNQVFNDIPTQNQVEPRSTLLSLAGLLNQAYSAFSSGNYAQSKALYRDVLLREHQQRDALLGIAAIAIIEGQQQQALSIYYDLLVDHPEDEVALSAVLSLHDQLDRIYVETELRKLQEQYPGYTHLDFILGNLYAKNKQWPEAQRAFFNAWIKEYNPNYAYNLAVSLDHMNQPNEALRYYQKASKLAQTEPVRFSIERLNKRMTELSIR